MFKDTVLIVATLLIDRRKSLLDRVQSEFDWIFNLDQAVVLIIFNYIFAHPLLEESSVWENKLAPFKLGGVWRQKVLHKPREILFFYLSIVGNVDVKRMCFSF